VAEQLALSFAGLVRQLRAEAGLTQEELAQAAGLPVRTLSDLERGISRTAHKDTAGLLAGALGLPGPVADLFAAAARGRAPAAEVLAAREGAPALQNNLPAQLSAFIGRGRELAEVQALVESSRLVTLTGAGGCGKTRLGLRVAAGLLDGSGDGVWLVELAAVTEPDGVAPAIAGALRLAAQSGRPVLEALLDALAPLDVLIVLDNCEHLIGGCAKTAEAIVRRCPRVRLIATSREPLGIGGETIYRVPSLSLPGPGDCGIAPGSGDAVALFWDRATAQGVNLPAGEQATALVVSVCRRLDGMPLAIELAAARLRSLSLSELHDRLDQRFRLLTGGSRTALERQQTLQATVSWSYSLLNQAEQQLLARLSVFAGSFALDAAEAMGGFGDIDLLEVAGLLGSLVDKSLVVAEPAQTAVRYRLLETIRLFAAERLADAGDQEAAAAAAAHCAHFLTIAEAAAPHLTGPEQGTWLARLDADQANLRRAAQHAAGRPDGTALVLRLGVALERYWIARSRIARSREQEAFGLLVPVLQRPDAGADPGLFAAALATAAAAAWFGGIAGARHLGEQAVEIARDVGDDRLLIMPLAALCGICFFAGEPETGLPFGQEAVERARHLGDDVLLAVSLLSYLLAVDPARSLQLVGEAIACTERTGDHLINSILHNNAGSTALITGDIPAARAHLEAAAQAAQAIGWEYTAVALNLGLVLRAEADPDGAQSTFETALRVSRRHGDNEGLAYACLDLACMASDQGDWHRAAVLHGAAQAFCDRTRLPWQEPEARNRLNSLDQARAHLGDEQLEQTYATGMALSLDQALDLALRRPGSA
jgi:predicted ATPase/DNA-binding XRE family transcriptional regulator